MNDKSKTTIKLFKSFHDLQAQNSNSDITMKTNSLTTKHNHWTKENCPHFAWPRLWKGILHSNQGLCCQFPSMEKELEPGELGARPRWLTIGETRRINIEYFFNLSLSNRGINGGIEYLVFPLGKSKYWHDQHSQIHDPISMHCSREYDKAKEA